jgi:hypothetical protein
MNNKRPFEGSLLQVCSFFVPCVLLLTCCCQDGCGPVHANKTRAVDISIIEKTDEELNTMRSSKDANVQVRGCVNLWQIASDQVQYN